jgi:hypothetical protein
VSCRGITFFLVYLAWRIWQSVLRLAVRGKSISGRVDQRQRVPVFEEHRLPSTASRRDIRQVSCRGITCIFVYLAWRLWQSVLRLLVRGNSICGRVVQRQRVPVIEEHRLPSTASRRDIRQVSCRGITCIFVYLAWRVRQSVLRLAVGRNSISGRVDRRQRVPVFEEHRLPSTASRLEIRQVSCRGITCIFVYLAWRIWQSVLRLLVRGNSISGRVVRRQKVRVFEGHRLPSTASRWYTRWVSCRGNSPIFVYLAWRLRKCVLRLAVSGNSSSGRVVRRRRDPVFDEHRLPSTASQWDIR